MSKGPQSLCTWKNSTKGCLNGTAIIFQIDGLNQSIWFKDCSIAIETTLIRNCGVPNK